MTNPNVTANLRSILAELYREEASQRRVAGDAGLDETRIAFSPIAQNSWMAIWVEAEKANKVQALLDVAVGEYPTNLKLQAGITAYRAAKQSAQIAPKPEPVQRRYRWPLSIGIVAIGIVTVLVIAIGLYKWFSGPNSLSSGSAPQALPHSTPTSTITAATTVTAIPTNTAFLPQTPMPQAVATKVNPKDGAVYVWIAPGDFLMGASISDTQAVGDEQCQEQNVDQQCQYQGQRQVSLSGFWMMKTEVTNAQYKRCMATPAKLCKPPNDGHWNDPNYANHPVTGVTWEQAKIYADWAGGRLPTEAEWEKACRGTDGRIYPWSNQIPNDKDLLLNDAESKKGDTMPVGSYPQGASPYGALDMAGNVWEWTADWYDPDYFRHRLEPDPKVNDSSALSSAMRALRGGSFNENKAAARCTERYDRSPLDSDINIGFRLVLPN